jgi:predicted nucleotidyltransferase
MVSPDITLSVRKYLRALVEEGIPVRYGILFGSHVKGHVHEWSDIDLFVVSPRFDQSHELADIGLLWRTAARIDSRIEPLAVGERQLAEDRGTPILEIARREGEIV